MRVLIAPDKFAGTLTAPEAARAIARGWARHAPQDVLDLAPMSDGGPGFVDVLHTSLGGEVLPVTVRGPYGEPRPARILRVGHHAYLESAQACGLHLCDPDRAEQASSAGVGDLVLAAAASGARTVVVGLGGTGTTDAGAGALGALGAGADVPLDRGPAGLVGVSRVGLPGIGVDLVIASDVDNPLTGLFGAAKVFGPQKGLVEERIVAVDGVLEQFATAVDRRLGLQPGAGAGGGLGFGLLALGASREPGLGVVAGATDLAARAAAADLVLTGEGAFDFSSRAGKVPFGVAEIAAGAIRPCVLLAGQVLVGAREMRALGIESAYSMVDLVGEEAASRHPADSLADLAARVARTWHHG